MSLKGYSVISMSSFIKVSLELGLVALELPSYILEIPNDAYTALSQNLIGCSTATAS
mgnify:CR=1 FL=1